MIACSLCGKLLVSTSLSHQTCCVDIPMFPIALHLEYILQETLEWLSIYDENSQKETCADSSNLRRLNGVELPHTE